MPRLHILLQVGCLHSRCRRSPVADHTRRKHSSMPAELPLIKPPGLTAQSPCGQPSFHYHKRGGAGTILGKQLRLLAQGAEYILYVYNTNAYIGIFILTQYCALFCPVSISPQWDDPLVPSQCVWRYCQRTHWTALLTPAFKNRSYMYVTSENLAGFVLHIQKCEAEGCAYVHNIEVA